MFILLRLENNVSRSSKKSIPELTIDESLRLKSELDNVAKKLEIEQSNKDLRILELEERAKKTEIILTKLMKRL